MNRNRLILLATAASCVFLASLVISRTARAADEPWSLPALTASPEAIVRAATAQPAPKDGDVEMLYEEHTYKLDEQGREHRIARRFYRYLTPKGVDDWSCTEADWTPSYEAKPIFRVRVITPDGQAHALDPESIGEAPAEQDSPDLLSDDKVLRAPLPAIAEGAIVEEEIETRENLSLFDRGIVERFMLTQQYPCRKLRLVIDAPTSLPLKYEVISSDAKPVTTESNGRRTLVFELGPLPATPPAELYLPPEEMKSPQVVFSTGKSWADVAASYADLVESKLDLETVRPLVEKAIGKETDRDKIITLLLAALRSQIRYTGIEFGKGAIVPRASHETLARRYGDCKDQATLLVAMLRVAGIRANVALLRTGRYDDIAPNLPGLGDFDHAIVYVPGDKPLWIDPSDRCAPAGFIPLTDQNRLSLLASRDTTGLIHTATMDYHINAGEQLVELFPSDNGKGHVRMTVSSSGSFEDDLREDYASLGIKALRKRWKERFKEQYHAQASMRLDFSKPLDLTKPFHVTAEAADARIGQFDETTAAITLQPDSLFQRLPDMLRGIVADDDDSDSDSAAVSPLDGRKGSLLLPEPHLWQLQYRITLPAGYTVKALPDSSVKQFGPATIGQYYAMAGDNVVVATFNLDTGPGRFTAEQVDDLRQAIVGLAPDDNTPWEVKIELENVAGADMAAGRVAQALALARADLARYGARADQHDRYARMLLKAGLGDAARAEARKAVELESHSALAYANLARVLTYDSLGRQFRPGMDWSGAAAAYQKALELDPADVATRMDWAILLEHDADGLRYAPGTRLDEAIDEYRKAQRQLGVRNRLDALEVNLARDLLFRERYGELEKLAARAEKSASWRGFLVAAVAARLGVSDADKRATEIAPNADARREILQNAADDLQQARLYAASAALYEAAAGGAEKPDEIRAKARAISQLRRMEPSDLAQDAPRRAVQQLFAAALSGSKAAEKIPAMFASTATPGELAAARQALHRAVEPALSAGALEAGGAATLVLDHGYVNGPALGARSLSNTFTINGGTVNLALAGQPAVGGLTFSSTDSFALDSARDERLPPLRIVDAVLQSDFKVEGDAVRGYRVTVHGEKINDSAWQVVLERGHARIVPPSQKPAIFRDMAWSAVVSGKVTEQSLAEAQAAVKQSKHPSPASLRTLAAVYAELGKTSDALENLRRAVELRGERMDDGDWYVLGRIAEQYGLAELAAELYRKVPLAPLAAGDDLYSLAQRRLKKVEKR